MRGSRTVGHQEAALFSAARRLARLLLRLLLAREDTHSEEFDRFLEVVQVGNKGRRKCGHQKLMHGERKA